MHVRRYVAMSVLPIALLAAPASAVAASPTPPGVTSPAPLQLRNVSSSIGSTFTNIPADGKITPGESYTNYSVSAVVGTTSGDTSHEYTFIGVQVDHGHGDDDGRLIWDRGEFYTPAYGGDPGVLALNGGLTSGHVRALLTDRSTFDYATWEHTFEQSDTGWLVDLAFVGDKGTPYTFAGAHQDSYSGFRFISHGQGLHRDGQLRGILLGQPDPQSRLGMRQMSSAGRGGQGTLQFCQRECVPF